MDQATPASTTPPSLRLVDGPSAAPATLVLAHGAGAPMDSPFMAAIASGLADHGWRVVRFAFPYMARQQLTGRKGAPDALPTLLECFRSEVGLASDTGTGARAGADKSPGAGAAPLIIGGKSLGGRVASLLADALAPAGVRGCLCLGYPFHPPGKPLQTRTRHLVEIATPTLILQGERDPFGRPEEVETYRLSPQVRLAWIPGGDHSFKPSRASGRSESDNRALAVQLADRFCRDLLDDQAAAERR